MIKKIKYLLKIITNNEHYIWRLELFFKNMADINPAFIMPQNNVIITFIRSRRLILNFELSYILILFFFFGLRLISKAPNILRIVTWSWQIFLRIKHIYSPRFSIQNGAQSTPHPTSPFTQYLGIIARPPLCRSTPSCAAALESTFNTSFDPLPHLIQKPRLILI